MSVNGEQNQKARQEWMGVLASANSHSLILLWNSLGLEPEYRFIRKPETGLTMVRGRIGGSGQAFNMGEMTLTRCAIRLRSGTLGVSYVAGRDTQKSVIAAIADAMLQESATKTKLLEQIIQPLQTEAKNARDQRAEQAYSTKVDFFTLVRGED